MLPFLLTAMKENCEDDNVNDDRCIYKNGDVSNHDYHVEDGSIVETGEDEGKPPMFVGGFDRRILDVDECGTRDDDDGEDINKIDVLLLGLPCNATTGLRLIHLASNRPPSAV